MASAALPSLFAHRDGIVATANRRACVAHAPIGTTAYGAQSTQGAKYR